MSLVNSLSWLCQLLVILQTKQKYIFRGTKCIVKCINKWTHLWIITSITKIVYISRNGKNCHIAINAEIEHI